MSRGKRVILIKPSGNNGPKGGLRGSPPLSEPRAACSRRRCCCCSYMPRGVNGGRRRAEVSKVHSSRVLVDILRILVGETEGRRGVGG